MIDILRQSYFYRFAVKFIRFFSESYDKSFFKGFIDGVRCVFANSVLGRILKKYVNKKPLFMNSVTVRVIKFIGRVLGKIADKINGFFSEAYENSFLKKFVTAAGNEKLSDKVVSVGLFFMISALSFLIFSVFMGKNYDSRIYVSWGMFFVGTLVVSAGKRLDIVKQSVSYRAVKYIIELVKV